MKDLFPVSSDFLFPDTAFDNFFNGLLQPSPVTQIKLPKVDIEDTEKAYIVTADIPGAKKEDINISYDNEVLSIASNHSEENEEKDDEKHFIRKERYTSSFNRQFIIRNIQKDGIEANFENGVLTITLPKADPTVVAASNRIAIK